MQIPAEVIAQLVTRMDQIGKEQSGASYKYIGKLKQEIIEDLAYDWVDKHPDTLWTGLELVEALKDISK